MFGPLAGKLSPLGGSRRNSHEVTARPHPASDDAAAIDELAMALFKVAQTGGKLSKSSRKKAQAQAAKQVKQLAHGDDAPPPTTSQPVNNTSTTSHKTTEVAEHPSSTSTSDSQDSVEATPRPRPAPLGPASAPMDLSSTLVTLAEADETTKDTVISNHDVALHLKRILRQAELNGAGETSGCPTVDEDLVPVFSCLSRPSVMNGAEVLDAFNCSHPHSVWKELEDGTPKTKQQSIVRLHLLLAFHVQTLTLPFLCSQMVSCDLSGLGTKSHKVVLAEYHHRDPHTGKTIPKHRRSHSRSSSLSRTLGWKNHWLPFGKPKPGQQVDQDDEKPIVWYPSLVCSSSCSFAPNRHKPDAEVFRFNTDSTQHPRTSSLRIFRPKLIVRALFAGGLVGLLHLPTSIGHEGTRRRPRGRSGRISPLCVHHCP